MNNEFNPYADFNRDFSMWADGLSNNNYFKLILKGAKVRLLHVNYTLDVISKSMGVK